MPALSCGTSRLRGHQFAVIKVGIRAILSFKGMLGRGPPSAILPSVARCFLQPDPHVHCTCTTTGLNSPEESRSASSENKRKLIWRTLLLLNFISHRCFKLVRSAVNILDEASYTTVDGTPCNHREPRLLTPAAGSQRRPHRRRDGRGHSKRPARPRPARP